MRRTSWADIKMRKLGFLLGAESGSAPFQKTSRGVRPFKWPRCGRIPYSSIYPSRDGAVSFLDCRNFALGIMIVQSAVDSFPLLSRGGLSAIDVPTNENALRSSSEKVSKKRSTGLLSPWYGQA